MKSDTKLEELLATRRTVFLDFDGPVCAVFTTICSRDAADSLRALVQRPLPSIVNDSADPFDVLRYAAESLPTEVYQAIEKTFTELECSAVTGATPTPGAASVIKALHAGHFMVGIVTNNSREAVTIYLDQHGLGSHVYGIFGRPHSDASLLKPSPYLVRQAMDGAGADPADCMFVGDSVSDIEAARASQVAAVGFANRQGKAGRLRAAG
ncbi:HAD family hydrolase, partial [Nocardia ninae]